MTLNDGHRGTSNMHLIVLVIYSVFIVLLLLLYLCLVYVHTFLGLWFVSLVC